MLRRCANRTSIAASLATSVVVVVAFFFAVADSSNNSQVWIKDRIYLKLPFDCRENVGKLNISYYRSCAFSLAPLEKFSVLRLESFFLLNFFSPFFSSWLWKLLLSLLVVRFRSNSSSLSLNFLFEWQIKCSKACVAENCNCKALYFHNVLNFTCKFTYSVSLFLFSIFSCGDSIRKILWSRLDWLSGRKALWWSWCLLQDSWWMCWKER